MGSAAKVGRPDFPARDKEVLKEEEEDRDWGVGGGGGREPASQKRKPTHRRF